MADTRLLFKNKLSLKSLKTVPTPSPPKPPPSPPTAPKPMAAPQPPSALRIKRMVATRAELTRRFPKCFPPIGSEPRPLKIGIKRDIIAAAPDLDRHDLINAIAVYCGDN